MQYSGNSIVDYLSQTGQKTDFASRAQLAASKGIQGYSGSAQQNTQLLNLLRGSQSTPTPAAPQASPAAQPVTQPATQASAPQQTSGQPSSVQDLISQGFYGYQGWDNAGAIANFKATGGQGKGGPSGGGGGFGTGTFANMPTINLPELYQSLYASSGVSDVEKDISAKTMAYNQAVASIKDNPYLSEATMTGRLRKLEEKFNADTQALRGDVATRKADIETQLNLQTKQFDINSQQAQLALSQFGALLDSGALNSATNEDIANITRSTGLSSSIIRSAVQAKIQSGYSTEVQSFDNGVDEGFVIYTIDQTGNIVNQTRQVTGKSAKSSQYSTDPMVSSFIENYLNQQSNISELWPEPIQGPGLGYYGSSDVYKKK